MKKAISFPIIQGQANRQAHVAIPKGCFEREMGQDGFYGPASHIVHRHPPTGWVDWEGPLRPHAFDLNKILGASPCPWQAVPLLYNTHMRMRWWPLAGSMGHLVRNADGDDVLFVHQGSGVLYCDYGSLNLRDGDYVMIPKGTLWRLTCDEPMMILLIEATTSHYRLPDKGMVGPHAIFDPAVLDVPQLDDRFFAQQDENPWQVRIKKHEVLSTVTFPFNPLDAVGWHGDLCPVKINWRDFRPLMSHRYHLPPSAHTTFVADRFVICTFCPRPLESDPDALRVPFYHNNDDFDEVLFYHAGDFFSRDNIHPGMLTFHPCGFTHGPHPKALKAGMAHAKTQTDEVAVMIDARDALSIAPQAAPYEWSDYVHSWKNNKNEVHE